MRWTGDVASGAWIGERLQGWGCVGGTVPRGFEAYARVFHPVEARRLVSENPIEVDTRTMTWADVASARGTTWHPVMQWASVSGSQFDEIDLGDGWTLGPPDQGRLPLAELAAICELLAVHTSTPADTVVGVWGGWGLHPASGARYVTFTADSDDVGEVENFARATFDPEVSIAALRGPLLALPGRDYVLLAADVRELTDPGWVHAAGIGWNSRHGPTPNLLWPADRAWCLASEIDFDSTLIGGSRALSTADTVNPPASAP